MAIDFDATPRQQSRCEHHPLLEYIWAGHFVLDRMHHSARPAWVEQVWQAASGEVAGALRLCQQANFPLINLLGLLQKQLPKLPSFDAYIAWLEAMDDAEFRLEYFDGEVTAQQLDTLMSAPQRLTEFLTAVNWAESGSEPYMQQLIFEPGRIKAAQLLVLKHVMPFAEQVLAQEQDKIADAISFVEQQLKHNAPMALAQQIKGSHYRDEQFDHFLFCPCLFADTHNVFLLSKHSFAVLYNCEQSAFHVDSQAEPLAEAFKVIADPKRLEILRMVKKRPTFAKVLAARLGLTTATMSRHLELLRNADLIREQKIDRVKYIHLNEERFRRLQGQLNKHVLGDG
ncbi:ArsR/SmtB family transcription factor [Salinibius halmophilus]|uniref:ArsR/SmtB family transcription factor n=1 Tax=Salinibius halmophilus TaxID=1853216 RepID=UPI0013141E58|nr:winged helix-turn-helix domain-containing protein [Salinibius halmophilus]